MTVWVLANQWDWETKSDQSTNLKESKQYFLSNLLGPERPQHKKNETFSSSNCFTWEVLITDQQMIVSFLCNY